MELKERAPLSIIASRLHPNQPADHRRYPDVCPPKAPTIPLDTHQSLAITSFQLGKTPADIQACFSDSSNAESSILIGQKPTSTPISSSPCLYDLYHLGISSKLSVKGKPNEAS
ncbi:hypothetical protein PGT21_021447 [Puccinia graminis f. sp. tritici]|uniref:Uncharacterized protein n=1 Tax=Puccinia graminis f. sp. tritici TaxID=56615 RepID=A0A5B0N486_PUCGR|nr:hypothetical protein PGT21_021447 [Puccinia graminis f. sp. tritici]KAA1124107.1 hypothetical protein PGTUg99_027942 [Puccinia graminis f. sp. tritici]